MQDEYIKGKGAQINPSNKFLSQRLLAEHIEGLDEPLLEGKPKTQVFFEHPKKVVNKVDYPDLKMLSINPYQGCEHGCIYCYARNSHEYYGFSAGLDFETKIIAKPDAAKVLESQFLARSWRSAPVMLSGNTDCYQPLEKKLKITRSLLKVFLKYRNPVSILTKNALITRDVDILKDLAGLNLVHVGFSITSLQEDIRRVLEPRTASTVRKLKAIELFSKNNIPVMIMNAPIIPAINHHEIPQVLKSASDAGARQAGYTVVRLNGKIAEIARDWLQKTFPDRADKVWHLIQDMHDGKVNDTEWGRRMAGDGNIADMIHQLFTVSKRKYFGSRTMPEYDLKLFRRGGNYQLF
ncbi:MAG: PA0069 family radical SAM protein [Cyclobacteriaceae bacterium]|nr:PA0069 family radical SAM protein [Cyclobacteriaceae bacterium HetDA_MAG_MS6]